MRLEERIARNGIAAINIPAINMAFGPINIPTDVSVPLIMLGNLICKEKHGHPNHD